MGCYLEDYRVRVGTSAGRFSWRGVYRHSDANGMAGDHLGLTVLSSMVLAVLLVTGGVEQNPGLVVEVENTVRLLCTGCGRNLKSGIQREMCGQWYHYSCGSVKAQLAERENWNCDKHRTEKVKMLQEELQNVLRQIDELKARNREPEAKLQMAGTGERDTMTTKQKVTKYLVVGDSIVRNVGAEHTDMKVECFSGIKTEHLHRVMEKRNLVNPDMLLFMWVLMT